VEFSALSDVHPMPEKFSLQNVAAAYEQMHSGRVRFARRCYDGEPSLS
jgi:D-arabinose 1-dehydrogenase-like Zn-dependent alcohol dehydrogenase